MDSCDQIYYSLLGELEPALKGVPNAFAPGSACSQAYDRLLAARNRVLTKLDTDNDPDLEQMLDEAAAIQRSLCRTLLELRRP